jgi:hypothetical protein
VPQQFRREQITIGGLSYEPPLFSLQLGITIAEELKSQIDPCLARAFK